MASYGLREVAPPAEEPVSLAEAKLHCRVEVNDDDTYISSLITAARRYVEKWTSRATTSTTYRLTLDEFPDEIRPPRSPLQAVDSIAYIATDGTLTVLASTEYQVDTNFEPGRICPAYGESWPDIRYQYGAVRVTFTAGYGTADNVPDEVKQAILLLVAHWYEHREPVLTGTISKNLEFALESLLGMAWTGEYV